MQIFPASQRDLPEILSLQYQAYQSEARLLQNNQIPPLTQTLEDLQQEWEAGIVLKAVEAPDQLVGSVRGFFDGATLFIGKLMVAPGHQGKGIGRALLADLERRYPQARYELFTSSKSVKNLRLYQFLGYQIYAKKEISPNLTLVYLQKLPQSPK